MGQVEYKNVPSLIRDSALGIVLPNEESVRYTHPLKLLEFLSVGTPILTTKRLDIAKEIPTSAVFFIEDFGNDLYKFFNSFLRVSLRYSRYEKLRWYNFARKYSWRDYVIRMLDVVN